jgi:hypothetical protein
MSPQVTGKWAKECSIFNAFDGTDDVLWNESEQNVMVESSVVLKAPIVKMGPLPVVKVDTVTPIGEGRCNLTHFMY